MIQCDKYMYIIYNTSSSRANRGRKFQKKKELWYSIMYDEVQSWNRPVGFQAMFSELRGYADAASFGGSIWTRRFATPIIGNPWALKHGGLTIINRLGPWHALFANASPQDPLIGFWFWLICVQTQFSPSHFLPILWNSTHYNLDHY